jgi:hypothetical protein
MRGARKRRIKAATKIAVMSERRAGRGQLRGFRSAKKLVLSTIPQGLEVERSLTSIKHGEIVSRSPRDNEDTRPKRNKSCPSSSKT